MNINFNELRARTAYVLDSLTKKLNEGILYNEEIVIDEDGKGYSEQKKGNLLISTNDIEKDMKELRSLVAAICSVHEPDDDEFANVMPQVEKNGGLAHFNPTKQ